jgi:hypothetical protein
MHQISISDLLSLKLELLHHSIDVNGIPDNDEVCHKIEATDLVVKLFILLCPDSTMIGKIKMRPQTMQSFSLIELPI